MPAAQVETISGSRAGRVFIVMSHDERHLHRINSMTHAVILSSDGFVQRSQVDDERFAEWLHGHFEKGDLSVESFEGVVKPAK